MVIVFVVSDFSFSFCFQGLLIVFYCVVMNCLLVFDWFAIVGLFVF